MQQSPTDSTTYTTIPISGSDVISRSYQNLRSFISHRRSWPEFFDTAAFDRPDSLSSAKDRIRRNTLYFRLNYAIILCCCPLLSFLQYPLPLVLVYAVFFLWLVLYFFREDPLVLWDRPVTDRLVLVGLIAGSMVSIWFTGIFWNLIAEVAIGAAIVALHGAFRNPEGLFLDEQEAAAKGLIASGSSV